MDSESASAHSGSRALFPAAARAWLPTAFIILGLQEKAKYRQGGGRFFIGLSVGAAWRTAACRRGPHTLNSEIGWRGRSTRVGGEVRARRVESAQEQVAR